MPMTAMKGRADKGTAVLLVLLPLLAGLVASQELNTDSEFVIPIHVHILSNSLCQRYHLLVLIAVFLFPSLVSRSGGGL